MGRAYNLLAPRGSGSGSHRRSLRSTIPDIATNCCPDVRHQKTACPVAFGTPSRFKFSLNPDFSLASLLRPVAVLPLSSFLPTGASAAAGPEQDASSRASSSTRPNVSVVDTYYYDQLAVKPSASEREIRKAYFMLSKRWHPDKTDEEGAKEKFQARDSNFQLRAMTSSNCTSPSSGLI
eukprot:5275216-Amphidinium_carterae.1